MPQHQKAGNLTMAAFAIGYILARVAFGGPAEGVWLDAAVPFVAIAFAFATAHALRPRVP